MPLKLGRSIQPVLTGFFDSSIFREIPYRNAAKLSLKLQGMIIFGL